MRIYSIGLLLLVSICCACGSLKNAQQFQKQSERSETNSYSHAAETRKSSNTELITDSSSTAYDVQITPVGAFTYNTNTGFKGMATKVVLKGKQQSKMQQQREATSLNHLAQANLIQDQRENRKVAKTQEKTRLMIPAWLWVSLLIVTLSGCLYLLVRYRK